MEDLGDLAARLDAKLNESAGEGIDNEGWFTSRELAVAWNCTQETASRKLSRLVESGHLIRERRVRVTADGIRRRDFMYHDA